MGWRRARLAPLVEKNSLYRRLDKGFLSLLKTIQTRQCLTIAKCFPNLGYSQARKFWHRLYMNAIDCSTYYFLGAAYVTLLTTLLTPFICFASSILFKFC